MKIVHIIYSLTSGGAERFVTGLSNELSQIGHDVTICMLLSSESETHTFNRRFLKDNVRFHSMNFSRGFSMKKVFALEKYLLEQKPDVVHCHLNVIPYVFRLALWHSEIRFIHTLHSVAENASGKKWQKYINSFFYKHGYITPVTISERCRQSYIHYYDLPSPVSIDNGCEVPHKSVLFDEVVSEVESYKNNQNTPVFIHVARYHEQKNQGLLIDAFNELHRKEVDFVLLVIGDGFDHGPGADLKGRACEKIHFLGVKRNVPDYLFCSDAFCLTSFYEGLPISLLEAIACGVVPVCTRVGGVPDVITDGQTGYLCDSLDVEEYVRTLRRSLSGSISKENLIDRFMELYSMRKCAENYIRLYHEHE